MSAINITVNGKPFTPETFEDQLIAAMTDQVREKLGSIRHPITGEFPTIAVTGSSIDNLQVKIEGSEELLELVKQRLAESEDPAPELEAPPAGNGGVHPSVPRVFLSYAFEDRALASLIANELMKNGIDTWWAEWCISAGDSIRQKIDVGLGDCTHFVVLLTPQSVVKPWVNAEMDAGLVRDLDSQAKFIALRSGLSPSQLPPLLQGRLSPSVDAEAFDVSQLVNDIYGVTKKPALGDRPALVSMAAETPTGYSAAASALAKVFVDASIHAQKYDPNFTLEALAQQLQLSVEDVEDAVHELNGLVTQHRADFVYAEEELFVRFDKYWKDWDPSDDALKVAVGLVNDESFPDSPAEIGAKFNWEPRRLNPALAYLCNRKLVKDLRAMTGGPWILVVLHRTTSTRRFVNSRA